MLLQDEIMGRCAICGENRHTTNGICHECAPVLEPSSGYDDLERIDAELRRIDRELNARHYDIVAKRDAFDA